MRYGYVENSDVLESKNISHNDYLNQYSRTDFMNTEMLRDSRLQIKSMDYFILLSCSPGVDKYDNLPKSQRSNENFAMGVSRSPQKIGITIAGNANVTHSTGGKVYMNSGGFKTYSWNDDYSLLQIEKNQQV